MDKQSVRNTFMEMSNAGEFARIQLLPISCILDAACLDGICKVDKAVVLTYAPENVHVVVTTFNVVIRDLFNDKCEKWDIGDHPKYIPQLKKILSERDRSPQTKAIRAVIDCFGDLFSKWSGVIWCNHIPIESLEILVTISPSSVDVDLFRSENANSILHKSMPIGDPQTVVDNIIFWCKSVDKKFVAPNRATSGASVTSVFSSSSEIQEQLVSEGLCKEDSKLAAATINRLRKPRQADGCVPVTEVIGILSSLASGVDDNCFGSFADGWKEALTTAISRFEVTYVKH